MNRNDIVNYYTREEVSKQFVKNSKDREVAAALITGGYDKRPNIIQYISDIKRMVERGATSFHFSVEIWKNPMQLSEKNYDELRKGWDLIIDLDSKIGIEASQLAAIEICKLFERYGIKNYGIKFSGSRGFHICLPWKMFPTTVDYKPLKKEYPRVPRILASFIERSISDNLMKKLVEKKGMKNLLEKLDEKPSELNPFYFIELEKNWGERHMFRAPFSLNEKTWLVSQPLTKQMLKKFTIKMARPENINTKIDFFNDCESEEAADLFVDAMDWNASIQKEETKTATKVKYDKRIPESLFPPCIKNILNGLEDGRKRSLFTLINFLKKMNWTNEEIINKIYQWNDKNSKALPNSVIIGQLRYHLSRDTMPANCNGNGKKYMSSFYGFVCKPDETCKTVKNPVSYPHRKINKKQRDKKMRVTYKCDVCNKEFETMRGLNLHYSRMHENRV